MKTIVQIATIFKGVKEKPGNSGFYDHEEVYKLTNMHPEELFLTLGWKKGWAWCAFVPKAVWYLYYSQYNSSRALQMLFHFNASVSKTAENFKNSEFATFSKTPKKGAVAIWNIVKNGDKQWQGHAGIVVNTAFEYFNTIEGNTNEEGSREGTIVREKTRTYNFDDKNGLVLQGFILPPSAE